MVKLFLVEDEIVMRDGIKKHIDWEKEGIEFVGEASDGELALPMILELKPDILLTDIKMPFMDGLQLSERVRAELPDTRIIILSGYDEFSYAQEAVRLGVTEYLLKPISPAALLKSIKSVSEKIEEERGSRAIHKEETKDGDAMRLDPTVMDDTSHKMIENFLRTGTENEIPVFCDRFFRSIGEKNVKSMLFLNYILMDVYFSMARFLKEMDVDVTELEKENEDINSVVKRMTSWMEAKAFIEKNLRLVIQIRDSGAASKYGKLLRDAVSYIDEHYADEDISLNTVAAVANISPNHFSSIFSQEMGVTFIEYLINKRMEKAKELLMTTDQRSSEIAYQVGYKDPHYFSSTFKKTQGMTTREYRSRGNRS